MQRAANVEVAWAPPGGWICGPCDTVNLRSSGTFGNETCTKCRCQRTYMVEEIAERDTWELENFLAAQDISMPNDFPSLKDYVDMIRTSCSDIVAPEEEPFNGRMSEGGGGGGESKERSEEHRISTVVLANGKPIGMYQPVIKLSQWYFTMKELASDAELSKIDVNDLVENLGANIF